MIKNSYLDYFDYCDVNNSNGWAISQKLFVDVFGWVENTSQFSKYFIENCK